jgi:hypothetical protein
LPYRHFASVSKLTGGNFGTFSCLIRTAHVNVGIRYAVNGTDIVRTRRNWHGAKTHRCYGQTISDTGQR